MHLGKYDEVIEHAFLAIKLAMRELQNRTWYEKSKPKNKAKIYKIKRMFETLVLIFIDMSFAYEEKVDFQWPVTVH